MLRNIMPMKKPMGDSSFLMILGLRIYEKRPPKDSSSGGLDYFEKTRIYIFMDDFLRLGVET